MSTTGKQQQETLVVRTTPTAGGATGQETWKFRNVAFAIGVAVICIVAIASGVGGAFASGLLGSSTSRDTTISPAAVQTLRPTVAPSTSPTSTPSNNPTKSPSTSKPSMSPFTSTPTSSPQVASRFKQLCGGVERSCGILSLTGGVQCWGFNRYGQLGNGQISFDIVGSPADVVVVGSDVKSIACGILHTCALKEDGSLYCWGFNAYGQLGDGSKTDTGTPVLVFNALDNVQEVTCGRHHTCALVGTTKQLYCWGYNGDGGFGNGGTADEQTSPLIINTFGSHEIETISAGGYHTCAILTVNRQMKCWGLDTNGQLGSGGSSRQLSPVAVDPPLDMDVVSISLGYVHTCAITNTGDLYCFGYNNEGQLGVNDTTVRRNVPTLVDLGPDEKAERVSAISFNTCAVLQASGALKCWGQGGAGANGDDSTDVRTAPVSVLLTAPVRPLTLSGGSSASHYFIAQVDGPDIYSWGLNDYSQLGRSGNNKVPLPVN